MTLTQSYRLMDLRKFMSYRYSFRPKGRRVEKTNVYFTLKQYYTLIKVFLEEVLLNFICFVRHFCYFLYKSCLILCLYL